MRNPEVRQGNAPQGYLPKVYPRKRMFAQAVAELQKATTLSSTADYLGGLGQAYARAGRPSEARNVLDKLKEQAKRKYVSWRDMAIIYGGLEENDQAFICLEKAYEQRDSGRVFLKADPLFDPLRSDSRFQDLMRRIGLP